MTRAFRVAYDGREFAGFQRQPRARTVEGTLLEALADHGLIQRGDGPTHATPPGYAAAGRTDAGVSAVAQTVAFDAPEWLTPRAFNGQLPGSIRVWASADVPDGFHATHDADSRTYRYFLYAPARANDAGDDRRERVLPGPVVDDARVHDALDRVSGRHDVRNLTSDRSGTERDVDATATREGEFLVVDVSAGGFPRAFVRRVAALVRAVGTGTVEPSFVDRVLDPEPLPGGRGIGPAPPEPLVLWNVEYDDASFDVDSEAAESAVAAFGERYRDARRSVAVTDAILRRIGEESDAGEERNAGEETDGGEETDASSTTTGG